MSPAAGKLGLVGIVVLAGVLWFGEFLARDLWEPDEARYAYVAWEMRETGHWFVPQRNGLAYSHKPPLMFWLIHASSVFTGGEIGRVAARLPSMLGAVLALWCVSRLAREWGTEETAWLAVLMSATALRFWHQGGWGQIDMLLCGLELLAVTMLLLDSRRSVWWRPVLAFCAMGWAILAKGPVGLIVPVGIVVSGRLAAGQGGALARSYWLWGLPLALAWPAVWLLLAWWEGAPPAYFREVLFSQNLSRAAGTFGGHAGPVYYYIPYLLMDFLPWALLVPAAVAAFLQQEGESRRPMRLLLGWMLFVIAFFSVIGSKRGLYILIVYPAAALFVALAWPGMRKHSPRWVRPCAWVLCGAAALIAAASVFLAIADPLPVKGILFLPLGVAVLAAAWMMIGVPPLSTKWFSVLAGTVIACEAYAGAVLAPRLNAVKAPYALIPVVERTVPPGKTLTLYRIHGEILSLYARRPGRRVDHLNELVLEMARQGQGLLVCRRHEWDDLKVHIGMYGETGAFRMGNKEFVWQAYDMSGWPPDV